MSSVEVVGALREAVDRLLALDAAALGSAELSASVVELQRQQSRLVVAMGDALREWEQRGAWSADGSLSASLALGRDTPRCHRAAQHDLRRARLLGRMPHTRAAVLDGRLSIDHVDLILRYATSARFDLFLEHEASLVARLAELTLFDDARRLMQYWAQRADDLLGRRRNPPPPSTLYASRDHLSGELHLTGQLAPVDAEIVEAELRRLAHQIRLRDKADGVRRTPAQRRAAALVQMATRSVSATGMTARPLFQVIVGDETARHLCELASGIVIHPEDLGSHLPAAVVESFIFDGPSTILAATHRRLFTGALRRAIQVRDRRCQHRSGCPTPASQADVDHRRAHAVGGPTSQFNGRVECVPHNRLHHLHDEPPDVAPDTECTITRLDELRARIRWRVLHGDHAGDDIDEDIDDAVDVHDDAGGWPSSA